MTEDAHGIYEKMNAILEKRDPVVFIEKFVSKDDFPMLTDVIVDQPCVDITTKDKPAQINAVDPKTVESDVLLSEDKPAHDEGRQLRDHSTEVAAAPHYDLKGNLVERRLGERRRDHDVHFGLNQEMIQLADEFEARVNSLLSEHKVHLESTLRSLIREELDGG